MQPAEWLIFRMRPTYPADFEISALISRDVRLVAKT